MTEQYLPTAQFVPGSFLLPKKGDSIDYVKFITGIIKPLLDRSEHAFANMGGTASGIGVNAAIAAGVDATGVLDSTAGLQAALDALSPGDRLIMPEGTFLVSSSLTMTVANTGIIGHGASSIVKAAAANFHVFLPQADGLEFSDFTIWGAATTALLVSPLTTGQYGIYTVAGNANYGRLTRMRFSGPNGSTGLNNGAKLEQVTGWICDDVYIDRVIGNDATLGMGYGLLAYGTLECLFRDVRVFGNQGTSPVQLRHAVYLSGPCIKTRVIDCEAHSPNADGFPSNAYAAQGSMQNNVHENCAVYDKAVGSVDSADFSINGPNINCKWINCRSIRTGGVAFLQTDGTNGGLTHHFEVSGCFAQDAGYESFVVEGASDVYGWGNISQDNSRASVGSHAGLLIKSQSSGVIPHRPELVNLQVFHTTARRWYAAELTIATPPTFQTWGPDYLIINAVRTSGTVITITTRDPHGRVVGEIIGITDVTGIPQINGRWTVATTPTSTTLTFVMGSTGAGTYTSSGFLSGRVAHGVATLDLGQTEAMSSKATGVAGHFSLTAVNAYTLSLQTSAGVDSVGGGSNSLAITAVSNASPPVVTTSATHGLVNGMRVFIYGSDAFAINGIHTVSVVDSTHFQVDGPGASGVGTTGTVQTLGEVCAPTLRGWTRGDPSGPSPRGIMVPPGTGGVAGYGPVDVQDNGCGARGVGPLYACQPQVGAQQVRCARSGDIRVPDSFELWAAAYNKDAPQVVGQDRLLYRDPATGTFYISKTDNAGGTIIQSADAGEISFTFNSGRVIRCLVGEVRVTANLNQQSGQTFGAAEAVAYNASLTLDFNVSNKKSVTITGNSTLSFSNLKDGADYALTILNGSGAAHTITWPVQAKWIGGAAPTLSGSSKIDVIKGTSDGTSVFFHTVALDVR